MGKIYATIPLPHEYLSLEEMGKDFWEGRDRSSKELLHILQGLRSAERRASAGRCLAADGQLSGSRAIFLLNSGAPLPAPPCRSGRDASILNVGESEAWRRT